MNTVTNRSQPTLPSTDPQASANNVADAPTSAPSPFAITNSNPFAESTSIRYGSASTSAKTTNKTSATCEAAKAYEDKLNQSETISLDGKVLADAVLPSSRGAADAPTVRVSTFGANGVQANDMMVIQRGKPELGKPNVVLYMPEKDGTSFHEFNDL
jgi:hypothetical protein